MFAKATVALSILGAVVSGAPYIPTYATAHSFQPAYSAVKAIPDGYHHHAAPLAYAAADPVVATVAAPVAKVVEPIHPPQPYSFGYETVDEHGAKQSRQETSDAHNVKTGSYGFTDARGIFRKVDYIADAAGFRATVSTNEPGTAPSAPANAQYNVPVQKVAVPVEKVVTAPVVAKASYAVPTYVHGRSTSPFSYY